MLLPRYHFSAPEQNHYPFDPNGNIYHNGRHHVFYLLQDENIYNGRCCWGHASTTDFIHWEYHPIALGCEREGEEAMFSGCAMRDKNGNPVLVYFSVGEGICIATPLDDDLIRWKKSPANPVIRLPREGDPEFDVYNVFDPHCWLDDDGHYYVILGALARPYIEYDTAYMFRSDDLVNWEYLRPFYQATDHFTKRFDDCACPDFFKIGDTHALLCISHARGARYYLGDYVMHTFVPRSHHWLNWGGGVFAPETWLDDKGRRIACFWNVVKTAEAPWKSTQYWTLPRELKLAEDGASLLQFVPEEFKALYGKPEKMDMRTLAAGGRMLLPVRSRCCKLELSLTLKKGAFTFRLLSNEDGTECMELVIDRDRSLLVMDVSKSGIPFSDSPYIVNMYKAPDVKVTPGQNMPCEPANGDRYDLDIYLDNGMVEVFSRDGRYACAQMVLNSPDCDRMAAALDSESDARIERLTFIPLQI